MKEELHPRFVIQQNAKLVTELRERIHETFKRRDTSPEARAEWSRACSVFHANYDALAFPGGYTAAIQKIENKDNQTIEDALAFLEVRPYFFRSQYIKTKLVRLLKHAPLTARQIERFQRVLEAEREKKRVRKPYA